MNRVTRRQGSLRVRDRRQERSREDSFHPSHTRFSGLNEISRPSPHQRKGEALVGEERTSPRAKCLVEPALFLFRGTYSLGGYLKVREWAGARHGSGKAIAGARGAAVSSSTADFGHIFSKATVTRGSEAPLRSSALLSFQERLLRVIISASSAFSIFHDFFQADPEGPPRVTRTASSSGSLYTGTVPGSLRPLPQIAIYIIPNY